MDTREFRAIRGWSQTDLAVALDWSRQKVQRFEAGEDVSLTDEDRVRLSRLRALADRRSEDDSTTCTPTETTGTAASSLVRHAAACIPIMIKPARGS